MSDFFTKSRGRLLDASKKIYAHKLGIIFGFKALANAVDDELVKNLLVQVYSEEEIIVKYWIDRIKDLGGQVDSSPPFSELRLKILFRILSTKSFFEWILEEEEEGIRDVALQAELIQDPVQSETWSRYASDEIRHLQRTRNEILGMDSWDIQGTSGARSVATIYSSLYGGLISTLAFVTGIFGAQSDLNFILVAGLATLFAGSISSAGGAYQSLKAEMEVLIRESKRKRLNGKTVDEERKQLLEFYFSEGYSEDEATLMLNSIDSNKPSTIENAINELGLASREFGDPINSGITNGIYFAIAAMVPILPFTARSLGLESAMVISVCGTMICLFCIGAAKSIFSRKKWFRGGLEVMIFGALASGVTYLIGTLVSAIV
jgi:VIT1/CCC1 family predicted Fe2+/Mn2+ transporter